MKSKRETSRLTRRQLLAVPFALAKHGYRYEFPRDHFSHPEFRTEWWYYTGNLFTPDRRRFGFELTFFRQAFERGSPSSSWTADPVWLAHLALSDIGGNRFLHTERLNRSGPGLAGADPGRALVWNGNWQASPNQLRAVSDDFTLELRLQSTKAPVIHGLNGISQKANGEGRASHYISETRIAANGNLEYQDRRLSLEGTVWMDHEFFTQQLDSEQAGWDWLSLQLDDKTELMLFRLRRKDGSIDSHSAGTFIDGAGNSRHLAASDFRLTPSGEWRSPSTSARYPLQWRIEVPSLGIDFRATTPLSNQELVSRSPYSPSYWEGAMDFGGTKGGREIAGVGYLEMTGYDKPVTF